MALPSNAIMAFPNRVDIRPPFRQFAGVTPVFDSSVGQWQPDAPLTNLQRQRFAYKARSSDCTAASTRFKINLGTTTAIKIVAIPRHNLSLAATAGLTVRDSLGAIVATDEISVWPRVYPIGAIPFGHPSFWTQQTAEESLAWFQQPVLFVLPDGVYGRSVEIDISDTDNPDGYVELTRLFITPGWQPSLNFAYGAKIGIQDPTVVTTSLGSADFYDPREKRRVANISFAYLPADEAFGSAFDMQAQLGISGQLFFSYDPTDTANLARHSYVCTMTQLDGLTAASYGLMGAAFSLKEVVA